MFRSSLFIWPMPFYVHIFQFNYFVLRSFFVLPASFVVHCFVEDLRSLCDWTNTPCALCLHLDRVQQPVICCYHDFIELNRDRRNICYIAILYDFLFDFIFIVSALWVRARTDPFICIDHIEFKRTFSFMHLNAELSCRWYFFHFG